MRSTHYNSPIDTWACGCIMAELVALGALFPGTSEADQVYKICFVLGTPTAETWPDGLKLAAQMGFRYPPFVPTPLAQLVPNASYEALALLSDLLQFDPYRRPTASQSLQYPFFQANATLALAAEVGSGGGAGSHQQGFPSGEAEAAQVLVRQASLANSYQGGAGASVKVREGRTTLWSTLPSQHTSTDLAIGSHLDTVQVSGICFVGVVKLLKAFIVQGGERGYVRKRTPRDHDNPLLNTP